MTAEETTYLRDAAARISPFVAESVESVLAGVDVVAGVVAVDGDVARCMCLTDTAFCLIELARSGERLVVVAPLWRIRRVVETSIAGVTTVTVELDADRAVQRTEADGSVAIVPAGYEIGAAQGADGEVLRFAAAMRAALLGVGADD